MYKNLPYIYEALVNDVFYILTLIHISPLAYIGCVSICDLLRF